MARSSDVGGFGVARASQARRVRRQQSSQDESSIKPGLDYPTLAVLIFAYPLA